MLKQNFSILATAVVLVALTCAPTRAQQQSPTPASSNEISTGAITGLIVNERGQPMPGASVFFRSLASPTAGRSTSSDGEGRFHMTGLEPGLYTVTGYSPAYVFQPPEFDTFPAYYRIGDSVRVEMIKGGVITGTVANAAGEPLVGVRVRAVRVGDQTTGPPVRLPQFGIGERSTDDRGVYRIYGLAPGTYVVSAGGGPGNQSFPLNPYESDVPTYAPSSTRDGATEFTVRSGEETNADIRYRNDPGHTVSGKVKVNGNNGASVTLMPVDGSFMPAANTFQAPGASGFELVGVGDGEYHLIANEFPTTTGMVTTIPNLSMSDPKRITVRGADVSGIELITRPASSLSGQIALEPSKAPECQGKRQPLFTETLIQLQRHEKDAEASPLYMRVTAGAMSPDPKGAFVFRNVRPGRYRLNTQFHARYWYLRSISIGAPAAATATTTVKTVKVDPAASWTTIKAGEQLSNVTITLAEGAASIRGRVPVGDDAQVPHGAAIYLVPAETDKASDVLRYFVTNVSEDGSFSFNSLPPGRYRTVLQNPAPNEIATLQKLRLPESAEARTKLRRTAESQKSDVELKPCQTLADYELSPK